MKKFLAFLNRHKTKMAGFVLVATSAAQLVQVHLVDFQTFLKPDTFAKFAAAVGLVVMGLGFINTALSKQ